MLQVASGTFGSLQGALLKNHGVFFSLRSTEPLGYSCSNMPNIFWDGNRRNRKKCNYNNYIITTREIPDHKLQTRNRHGCPRTTGVAARPDETPEALSVDWERRLLVSCSWDSYVHLYVTWPPESPEQDAGSRHVLRGLPQKTKRGNVPFTWQISNFPV